MGLLPPCAGAHWCTYCATIDRTWHCPSNSSWSSTSKTFSASPIRDGCSAWILDDPKTTRDRHLTGKNAHVAGVRTASERNRPLEQTQISTTVGTRDLDEERQEPLKSILQGNDTWLRYKQRSNTSSTSAFRTISTSPTSLGAPFCLTRTPFTPIHASIPIASTTSKVENRIYEKTQRAGSSRQSSLVQFSDEFPRMAKPASPWCPSI